VPRAFRQFDYDTVSDVILHLRYTAREAGGSLKQQAISELRAAIDEIALAEAEKGLALLFSARHEFPSAWHLFLHPTAGAQTLTLPLDYRFAYIFDTKQIEVTRVELLVQLSEEFIAVDSSDTKFTLAHPVGGVSTVFALLATPNLGEIMRVDKQVTAKPGEWALSANNITAALADSGRLRPEAVEDIVMIVRYTIA